MKILITVVAILIGLLGIAAGFAKVALVPAEVAFLNRFGFNNVLTVIYGGVQVAGGLAMMIPATRFYGSIVAAAAFALSVALLLAGGNIAFAGVSLIPVALAALIAFKSYAGKRADALTAKDA